MSGGARQEKGVISRWQDERGFGFIQPEQGAALFVHVSAFAATPRRPAVGDAVYFLRARDDKGKPRASWAAFAGVPQQAVTARALPDNTPRPWLAEPPRVSRRLPHLREWSHEQIHQVFPGSPRARCTHGL